MKNKYHIVLAAAVIMLMAFVLTGCGGENKKKDDSAFTFKGSITLNDIAYDVEMSGKDDGTFSLVAGNVPPTSGTYEYYEGKGYLFKFADSKENELLTEYDPATKELSFVYPLDLGPRGIGNVKLSYKDEKFTPDAEGWTFGLPVFVGQATFGEGILVVNLELQCKSDGTFKVYNDSSYAQQIEGTYTYANDVYTFTVSDSVHFDSYIDDKGVRSVSFDIAINNVPCPTTLTERVLSPN